MADKDFKVKNKLVVKGISSAGPLTIDASGNVDSTSYIPTQYGGTGTSTSPTSGQVLYSASGTNYAATDLSTLPGVYGVGTTAQRPGSPTAGQLYFNTDKKAFEVWTGSAWVSVAVNGAVPLAPTIGTVTLSGLTASVPFTGPTDFGDAAITSYTATSSGGQTNSNATSPISVSGLSAGTAYTFTVTATNSYGTSNASSASNSVTTASAPGTPTSVSASDPGTDGYAAVSWTAPASNGGSAITDYTIQYSSDSGSSWTTFSDGTSTSTSATVTGLTTGTAYIFRVSATNVIGTGSYSSNSSSFTPTAHDPGMMFPIRSYIVPSGGTTSVTFDLTSITGYTHLQLRASAKANGAAGATTLCLRFNSDSGNNYVSHYILGDGTVTESGAYTAANATTQSCLIGAISGSSVTPFPVVIDIYPFPVCVILPLIGFTVHLSVFILFASKSS